MKSKMYFSLLLLLPFSIMAQRAVLPSGGVASGNGSISYSVGEITYLTLTGDEGSISQGIQQPIEISVVLETPDTKMITLTAYPNPTTDFVLLQSVGTPSKNMVYEVFDVNGKRISTGKFDGSETKINMGQLGAAVYFLKISSENKIVKTFRILKK